MEKLPDMYLFPNGVSVFTHEYSHSEFDTMSARDRAGFSLAVFPLTKHRWRGAYATLHEGVFRVSAELDTAERPARASARAARAVHPREVEVSNGTFFDGQNRISFECYSFLRCAKHTSLAAMDEHVLRGLMQGGNRMRIFSRRRGGPRASVGVLGNRKPFQPVGLASMLPEIQREIFSAWTSRRPIVLTGDTGVGKTSQVPKMLLWFNYLFGGFSALDRVTDFEDRPLVLSLPRVALVRMHGAALLESLGFGELGGSPVSLRFGSMPEEEVNRDPRPYGLVLSTHKLTLARLFGFGTVILDEVHEHDQLGDILIAVARKHLHRLHSLMLMTATLDDDRERLEEFLSPAFVHIPGGTRFPITEVYVRNSVRPEERARYAEEELRNIADALRRHRPPDGACGILFVASVSQCESYKQYLERRLRDVAFYIIHGKVKDVDRVLAEVYANSGPSVIVSTPYLESSVTVRTATHVYDTGRVFVPAPFGGKQMIISRSMRTQRRGRVGRVRPGVYVYFYDAAAMAQIRRIDSEFLHNYVLYFRQFGLELPGDLLVRPGDLSKLEAVEAYIDSFGIAAARWEAILNKYYLRMVEYARVYARGGRAAAALDVFEREGVLGAEALEAILSLDLRARVIGVRHRNGKYVHTCEVLFGPYAGTLFMLTHRRPMRGTVRMISSDSFVEPA
ncbi:encapsidated ATP-dependent RNA helicase [Squirrelpox virus]|uniref:RNA helicase NPH-II n=1 Tax=Squirrelpox virus TaxID=240426 RepID=U3UBH1_9POXV|nr:encapsidated ATP-dependent RNA helicase [Squirrelpox virus]CCD83226.1 encapsidated ATP-dependent RNA helicase [Squirrelpox virus]